MKKPTLNKAEMTKQFIIEKSAPIFNKKGIAGTSLSDLTKATGLTKGSIYGNFKDKDDVAVCVFQYNVDNLISYLNRAMDKKKTCVGKLLAFPESYKRLYRHMITFGGCPIMNTAIEADDTHKPLSQMTKDVISHIKNDITGLLDKGKRLGEIKESIDTLKTADIIISLIEGGLFLSKLTGEKNYLMHSLEQVETVIQSSAEGD
ncbi:MAG: TetR/AcrR family transcriptional regulator [Proteobacteria bacterium]|nr:TetR/AcrR family transcriptional regulator [Pseudomonadota bacterium]